MTTTLKNKTDLNDDDSRWRMLRGCAPTEVFGWWGATGEGAIFAVPESPTDYQWTKGVYMIRLEDGWHWACSSDGSSVSCGRETYGDLPNGDCAWKAHLAVVAANHLSSAERNLAECRQRLLEAQNAYAKALRAAAEGVPRGWDSVGGVEVAAKGVNVYSDPKAGGFAPMNPAGQAQSPLSH